MRGLLLAAALLPATALAQDPVSEARRAFQQGAEHYEAGRYREAITAFRSAHALRPHPSVLFNIARCHENLAEFPEALALYERMLADPQLVERVDVQARIDAIRTRPVPVFVSSAPEGARVYVDRAAAPLPEITPTVVELAPGAHALRFELEGRADVTREISVLPAQTTRVAVSLQSAPPADVVPVVQARPDPPPPAAAPAQDAGSKILREIRTRRDGDPLRPRLGLLVGAGKYVDTSFAVGADIGVAWRRLLLNLHWLTFSADFVGGIDLELCYDHPFEDFDFFVGAGAGYMRIRREVEPQEGVIALPTEPHTAWDVSFVGGIDFFVRKSLAIGAALRLVRPFDDALRDRPGNGPDAFSLQAATVQITIHL